MKETMNPQSSEQKFRSIYYTSLYFFVLPVAVCFVLYFAIYYLDKNEIRIPRSITKNLWIPVAAVALGTVWSIYVFLTTVYTVIFEIPTEKGQTGKDTDFDYRLVVILWLMTIILMFVILALLLNYYL